jgi:hypothetical protein
MTGLDPQTRLVKVLAGRVTAAPRIAEPDGSFCFHHHVSP